MEPPTKAELRTLSEAIFEIKAICKAKNSKSDVREYGSVEYKDAIRHFIASSSEVAQLVVLPGNTKDLAKIMKVLKKYEVPFSVKGGGHGMAPGYSSTTGIHISMSRFQSVTYSEKTQLVSVGAGCLWDQVYTELAPLGRNVVGGAASQGVGVAGWLLGGGYSLKSNRYGLGIDNIVEFEIVLPNGSVLSVTTQEDEDLFNALRGGGNNFGIVTKFVLKTFSQGYTYGANLTFPGDREEEVKNAIVTFVKEESRQEAMIVAAFRHVLVNGEQQYNISVMCVFDGPKPGRKRDTPFQEFSRLSRDGKTWSADPAGWNKETGGLFEVSRKKLTKKKPKTSRRSHARSFAVAMQSDGGGTESEAESEYENSSFRQATFSNMSRMTNNLYSRTLVQPTGQTPTNKPPPPYSARAGSHRETTESDSEPSEDSMDGRNSRQRSGGNLNGYRNTQSRGPRPRVMMRYAASDESESEDVSDSAPRRNKRGIKQGNTPRSNDDDDDVDSDSDNELNSDDDDNEIDDEEDDEDADDDDDDDDDGEDSDESGDSEYFKSAPKSYATQKAPLITFRTSPTDSMGENKYRGRFGCLMISKFTKPLLDKIAEEAKKSARFLKSRNGVLVIVDAWPVHPDIFNNSPPNAAFPHKANEPYSPMLAYFQWESEKDDQFWLTKLKGTLNRIRVVARNLGVTPRKPAYYSNLSLETVPAHKIYRDNLGWLMQVKKKYDPTDVMGRSGGHKIPLPTASSKRG